MTTGRQGFCRRRGEAGGKARAPPASGSGETGLPSFGEARAVTARADHIAGVVTSYVQTHHLHGAFGMTGGQSPDMGVMRQDDHLHPLAEFQ
jgi:hypothetical protein